VTDDPGASIGARGILVVRGAAAEVRRDLLACEELMAIRAPGSGEEPVNVVITMRTPGRDEELAAGHAAGRHAMRAHSGVCRSLPARVFLASGRIDLHG